MDGSSLREDEANFVEYKEASKKYGREVFGPLFSPEGYAAIPFNETVQSKYGMGPQHWYELPLACKKVKADTGVMIKGRLFTSIMLRNVDQDWPELDGSGKYPAWLSDPSETDPNPHRQAFKANVHQYGLKNVVALVEDREPPAGKSSHLWDYYAALGLVVVRSPTQDFNCPNPDAFKKGVEITSLALHAGRSTLIHCWGGSGRTGTYAIGVLKMLGVQEPVAWARQVGKSVYLDVHEQEQFVQQMPFYLTTRMLEVAPSLAHAMINAHQQRLSESGDVKSSSLDPETVVALRAAFSQVRATSASELGGLEVEQFLAKMAGVVRFRSPMTAKDRPNMPAGTGAVGSYPLPSPEGDADRQPTPLESEGDYWSNQLHGDCLVHQPAEGGAPVAESSMWT